MKALDRFSIQNLEKIVKTVHKGLPHIPTRYLGHLTAILPYVCLLFSMWFICSTLIPAIPGPVFVNTGDVFVLDILVRVVSTIIAIILILAFKPLSFRAKKGWDSLWYVSIFYIFFSLMSFNMFTLLVPLILWYILFEVRNEYN